MTKIIFKFFFSIFLLTILFYKIDLNSFLSYFDQANIFFVIIVLFLLFFQFPITANKWSLSLNIHGLSYGYIYLLIVCFVSFFYNNFLPTNIGGDGYRVLKTMKSNKISSISSVVYERIVGLFCLLVFGLISALYLSFSEFVDFKIILFIFLLISSLVFIFIVIFFEKFRLIKIKKLNFLYQNIDNIKSAGRKNIALFFYSFIFQFVAILTFLFMFKSFGGNVSFEKCAIIVTISSISALLPISFNGIGVFEGSVVASAVSLGVDYGLALAASIFLRLMLLPLSFIGGILSFVNLERFE